MVFRGNVLEQRSLWGLQNTAGHCWGHCGRSTGTVWRAGGVTVGDGGLQWEMGVFPELVVFQVQCGRPEAQ